MPPTSASVVVFAVALATTAAVTPLCRAVAQRLSIMAPVTDRAVHSRPVAYLGGVAMLVGFLVAFGVAWTMTGFAPVFETASVPLGVALGAVVLCGVGTLDDVRDVSAPAKTAGVVLAGSVMYALGVSLLYFRVPVFDTLFLSEAFYSAQAKAGFVKTPIEHLTGFQRSTQLYGDPNQVTRRAVLLGNTATQPPTVDGWPEDEGWLSAQALVDRANVIKYLIRDAKTIQDSLGIDVADLLPPGLPTSLEVVDSLALRLHLDLTTSERDQLATYLDTDRQGNGTIISSPFDASNPTHIDQRVRGLLYMMALHPTYLTR